MKTKFQNCPTVDSYHFIKLDPKFEAELIKFLFT